MLPTFRPSAVDPAAMDESSRQSIGMGSVTDDNTMADSTISAEDTVDKSDSDDSTSSEEVIKKPEVPQVKDKKEATEIFKELLRDKVSQKNKTKGNFVS